MSRRRYGLPERQATDEFRPVAAARKTKFYRDKQHGKWLGVCSGIADYTGVDATIVRIAMVLGTLMGMPLILFYIVAGIVAPKKPAELFHQTPDDAKFWQGVRASPRQTVRDVRARFRELDRRLAHVETYVTSSNTRLSQEIEQLR
jgi:phage shock protein C